MWSWSQLEAFLIGHGSLLVLPLAIVEGPVVAVAGGFLTAGGYLDWRLVLSLLVCGDLIGDVLYYWFGRLSRTPLERLGRRFGVGPERSARLRHRLINDSVKLLLIGKWTHAIGAFVLIGAGMVRMPLLKFMAVNLLGTVPKIVLLFAAGYFLGNYYRLVSRDMFLGSVMLFAIGTLAVVVVLRRRGDGARDQVCR